MIMISFAPLIGDIAKSQGITPGKASFGFMALHSLMTAVGCAISGRLIDRFGTFMALNAAMVILIVSNTSLIWFGHGYWFLVVIRAIEAMGCAVPVVAIGPVVAHWFPRSEVGVANGAQSVAVSSGMIVGLNLAPALAKNSSTWQAGLASLSLGNCVALVFLVIVGIMAKKYMPIVPVRASERAVVENKPKATTRGDKKYLISRPFIIGAICMAGGLWTQGAFNDLTPGYLAIAQPVGVGFGAIVAGSLFSTVLFAGIAGSILGGVLMDKVFGGKAKPVVLLGFAMIAVCMILLMMPQVYNQRPLLLICLALAGMGTPFINPIILGLGAETFPAKIVGEVIGIWMSVALFSQATGVMVGSIALNATGNYHLSLKIISAIALIGFFVAFFIPRAEDPLSE
jgi:MFS family permease